MILVPRTGHANFLSYTERSISCGNRIDVDATGRILDIDGVVESVRLNVACCDSALYRKDSADGTVVAYILYVAYLLLCKQTGEDICYYGLISIAGIAIIVALRVCNLKIAHPDSAANINSALSDCFSGKGNNVALLDHRIILVVRIPGRMHRLIVTLRWILGVDGISRAVAKDYRCTVTNVY